MSNHPLPTAAAADNIDIDNTNLFHEDWDNVDNWLETAQQYDDRVGIPVRIIVSLDGVKGKRD